MALRAKVEVLWGLAVGDALAMPVHWYYDVKDIKSAYGGWISDYQSPKDYHPFGALTLSDDDAVVGKIILHDKLKYWTSGIKGIHYHRDMSAGDNTLNVLVALQIANCISEADADGTVDPQMVREAAIAGYVTFMTTPSTHNDTYAETFHRLFFQNWATSSMPHDGPALNAWAIGRYSRASLESEEKPLSQIGGLVLSVPWIVHYASKTEKGCADLTCEALKMTHPAPAFMGYVHLYARLLHRTIHGLPLKESLEYFLDDQLMIPKKDMIFRLLRTGKDASLSVHQYAVANLGLACYVEGAMASLFYLAMAFHDNLTMGLTTNANCGGENAHRGALLGALLAAASRKVPQHLKDGLRSGKKILQSIL